ncbi:MAG: hypothetical protein VB138_01690 [Burkholderia sp.]
MHSGLKTPFACDAHPLEANAAAAFFPALRCVLLVFLAAIRRDGDVIPLIRLIRPMSDREVPTLNFSMETGG